MALPGQTTLGALRNSCWRRADMAEPTDDSFVKISDWNEFICGSYQELYDLLVTTYEGYSIAPEYDLTTVDGQQSYALPDGSDSYLQADGVTPFPAFYKLLGVDLDLGSDQWVTLRRFNFAERNAHQGYNTVSRAGRTNLSYDLQANNLVLRPKPSGGQTVRVLYVPRVTLPVLDADVVDGVSGWEEYVIVDACIKALMKEQNENLGPFLARKQELRRRIEETAQNRDAGGVSTVTDVYGTGGDFGFGFGYGRGGW